MRQRRSLKTVAGRGPGACRVARGAAGRAARPRRGDARHRPRPDGRRPARARRRATTRAALAAARAAPGYDAPFTERDPLVSLCIPTYTNHVDLFERSLPSALAQDHRNLEVIVVGDAAPPETTWPRSQG